MDYRHDEWGVDVTVCGSQKGLMVPPGLGFVAVSEKARRAGKTAKLPRSYWDWEDMHQAERGGILPVHACHEPLLRPARGAADARRGRPCRTSSRATIVTATATRAAVRAWGLEIVCEDPREYSSSMTAFFIPDGHDADKLRADHPRAFQHVARRRAVEARRPRVPHRPSGQLQRSDARRDAERRRDGPSAGRRSASRGRRHGGDLVSCAGDL